MNLLNRIYLFRFSNHIGYTTGLRNYLTKETTKGNLNLKQLKYLKKNLYKKPPYIQLNIYPVSQAMIKGLTIEEIEKISKQLIDAEKNLTLCIDGKNEKYNKNPDDLEFMFNNYAKWKKSCSHPTLDRKVFIYTKLLKTARIEKKAFYESDYEYVERNAKNYFRFHKKMNNYKPIIKNIHNPKRTSKNMNYLNNDKSKENEKDMSLLD